MDYYLADMGQRVRQGIHLMNLMKRRTFVMGIGFRLLAIWGACAYGFGAYAQAPLDVQYTVRDVSYQDGTDGAILLKVEGGYPPYTYTWSHGAETQDAYGLAAGKYKCEVEDFMGNSRKIRAKVREADGARPLGFTLAAEVEVVHPGCPGQTTGAAIVWMDGGTPPFSYSWSNGGRQRSIEHLKAGDYTVTITDSLGDTLRRTVKLEYPPPLEVEVMGFDTDCPYGRTGSASVLVNGGVPPYIVVWKTAQQLLQQWEFGLEAQQINNLKQGTYYAIVTDAAGCQAQGEVRIGCR